MLYYLSSSESYEFQKPRKFEILKKVTIMPKGKIGILVKIDPPVIGQKFGLGDQDINYLILSPRFEGDEIYPIKKFPCFVYIIRVRNNTLPTEVVQLEEIQNIAWGEIYEDKISVENIV